MNLPKPGTQLRRVYDALLHGPVSPFTIVVQAQCLQYQRAISDLRNTYGVKIDAKPVQGENWQTYRVNPAWLAEQRGSENASA